MNTDMPSDLGTAVFDIGGSRMRAAFAPQSARISEGAIRLDGIASIETPLDPEEGMDALAKLIGSVAAGRRISAVSGCVAGVLDRGTIARSPNLRRWEGTDIASELRKRSPDVPIILENDAMFECLGEAVSGAGTGRRIVAYVTVGTGVGGGLAVDGRLAPYRYGLEPGQQVMDGEHTLESLASGKAIVERYGAPLSELGGEKRRAAVAEATRALAAGIYNTIVHWSPDIVVLGGSVILDNPDLFDEIASKLPSFMRIFPELPEIARAALGDGSGLIGAAVAASRRTVLTYFRT